MKKVKIQIITGISLFVILFSYQNCSQTKFTNIETPQSSLSQSDSSSLSNSNGETGTEVVIENNPLNSFEIVHLAEEFSCNPFNSGDDQSNVESNSGIQAKLSYIKADSNLTLEQKNQFNSVDYFKLNPVFNVLPTTLFLSNINVPTQRFDQGFSLSDNSLIKDENKNVLNEYFGLQMETRLKLSENDKEGYYELALISDDGSYLEVKENSNFKELINNEGQHAARMGCANKALYLDRNSLIDLKIHYNQGPRFGIANVLLWKYHGQNNAFEKHDFCKSQITSNSLFWDYNNNSAEGAYVTRLKSEGYKIVSASNFLLPRNQNNPCLDQNTNQISKAEFSVIDSENILLNLELAQALAIEAQLFEIDNGTKNLVQNSIVTNGSDSQTSLSKSLSLTNFKKSALYVLEVKLFDRNNNRIFTNQINFKTHELFE